MAADDSGQAPTGGLTPHLTIREGRAHEAIDFYTRAFGATAVEVALADDAKRVMHAHLLVNGASLMLNDDFPEITGSATTVPAGVTLHLEVDDADHWFARAVKAGGIVYMPLADQFWGARYGQIEDPFGHRWSIGARIPE